MTGFQRLGHPLIAPGTTYELENLISLTNRSDQASTHRHLIQQGLRYIETGRCQNDAIK